jgi:hypothetical protein
MLAVERSAPRVESGEVVAERDFYGKYLAG